MKNNKHKKKKEGGGANSPPKPSSTPENWKLKDITEKQLREAENPSTQDRVTVHRTDWLFISNCEPIAEMGGLRSGRDERGWEMLNPSAQSTRPPPKTTVPPKISVAEIQRQTIR